MTPPMEPPVIKPEEINRRNFAIACEMARMNGITTVLFTGKGEPTLYPKLITTYLDLIDENGYRIPIRELQTNGIALYQKWKKYGNFLTTWHKRWLSTVAISCVHYDDTKNRQMIQPDGDYLNLVELIDNLHGAGFSVRLSAVMVKGLLDNVKEIEKLVCFAKENRVEQLTIRPLGKPANSRNAETCKWVNDNLTDPTLTKQILDFLEAEVAKEKGRLLLNLVHGAVVYDLWGQNFCLTNCLTSNPDPDEIRQLIFSGRNLYYDWSSLAAKIF
jgi:pyruvate-formate lyase-activating enzyme